MSKKVDERVVEMQFDNKQFESGIKTSMRSLDNLKKGLNFDGATKSLDKISSSSKNIDFSAMQKGIETVSSKFTTLGIIGVTALQNITNAAIHAGTNLVKSLTLDPIISGFQEYELQLGSIQTILANTQSKGSTLNDVNVALQELNTYADKTIYNFAEMTRNIGTFTAAGVELDTAVSSIKGLSNLAAVSGSSSAQAATAMYQLSQAIAAGKIQLMDWNSVVNAGMGGEVFQEALKRTARNFGINVDGMIKKYGSFRESLTQGGWLTTEVLTETLKQLSGAYTEADLIAQGYTKDQAKAIVELANTATSAATEVKTFSGLIDTLREAVGSGWAQTWQLVFGDFEQAKSLFTGISNVLSDMINKSSDARNALLREGMASGWDQLLAEGITNEEHFIETTKAVAKEHGVAIDEMIANSGSFEASLKEGWLTSDMLAESIDKAAQQTQGLSKEQLKSMGYTEEQAKALQELNQQVKDGSVNLDDFAKKMTVTSGRDNLIAGFKNIFNGIMGIIEPIGDAFKEAFAFNGQDLYKITEGFRELTENFKISDSTAKNIKNTFKGLFDILSFGVKIVTTVVKVFARIVGAVLPANEGILGLTGTLGSMVSYVIDAVDSLGIFETAIKAASKPVELLATVLAVGVKMIGEFVTYVADKLNIPSFGTITAMAADVKDFSETTNDAMDTVKEGAKKSFNPLITALQKVSKMVNSAKEAFVEFAGTVKKAVTPVIDKLKEIFADVSFDDVLGAGGLVGIAVLLRKMFKRVDEAVGNFDKIIDSVTDVLDAARGSLEAWQKNLQASTLLKIAAAVAILAGSLLLLTRVDPDRLAGGLVGVSVLLGEVVATLAILDRIDPGGVTKAATTLIIISAAISILASALTKLKDFQSWDDTWPALVSVGSLLAGLTASAKLLGKGINGTELIKTSVGLVIFSTAIEKLAEAMTSFAKLDAASIGKSMLSLGVILGSITAFIRLAKLDKLKGAKVTIIEIATSMLIMYAAIELFGRMDMDKLMQGLLAVSSLMMELSGSMRIMSGTDMKGTAVSLVAMATALNMLIIPIELLGRMKLSQLYKGLMSVSTGLGAMSLTLKALSKIEGGGKNMLAMSTSLLVLSAAITAMLVPIGILGHMKISTLAVGLGSLALVLAGLAGTAKLLAPFGTSLFTVAGALALFGVAAAGVGAGMLALSVGLATLAASGSAGIAVLLGALAGILAMIPVFAKELAIGLTVFITEIANMAPVLADAFVTLILSALESAKKVIPAAAETFAYLITNILATMVEYTPDIAQSLIDLFVAALDILEKNIPTIVEKVADVVRAIVEAVTGVIGDIGAEDVQSLLKAISGLIVFMKLLSTIAGSIKNAIKGAAGMAAVMAILSGMLFVVSLLPVDDALGMSESLAILMTSLSATMFIITKIPVAGAIQGVGSLAIFVGGLTAVLTALGAINQIPGFSWLISEGSSVLALLGKAIGGFVGGIAGGALEGVTGVFPQIGKDLGDFMTNAKPFFDGLQNVDPNAMEGVKALASAILVLTAADVIEGLTSWFTGGTSLTDFGKEISEFAPYFKEYADEMEGIDTRVVTSTANAAKTLAEFAKALPKSGGVVGFFKGGKMTISEFGKELVKFGPKFAEYAQTMSDLDPNVVINSSKAAKTLAAFASALPNSGGLVSIFAGDNTLTSFGRQLANFGPNFASYANSISDIDPTVVSNSASAIKSIVDVLAAIPNSGGLVSIFTGDNTIGSLASGLEDLGNALYNYYVATSGVNAESVGGTAGAIERILNLFNNASSESASGVQVFVQEVNKIPSQMTKASDSVISSIKNMASVAKNNSPIIANAFAQIITNGANTIIAKKAVLNNAGVTVVTSFILSINNTIKNSTISSQASITSLFNAMIYSAQQVLKNARPKLQNEGKLLIQSFINGIKSMSESVKSAVQTIVNSADDGLGDIKSNFYDLGQDMIQGLINGIKSKRSDSISAAVDVALDSYNAAKKALDSNSPSKKFISLGEDSGEGLVIGLNNMKKKVQNVGSSVGESAILGANLMLRELPSILSGDINVSPRITPVLDLTNVTNGIGFINNAFGRGYGFQIQAPISYATATGRSITDQKEFTWKRKDYGPDILNAFDALGSRVDMLGDRISNMQMVLDTGAAVGGMSQKMDKSLGTIASRKGRNI